MFAKLLKYDCRAVFKYWWIGAVSSLILSLLGGLCIQIIDVDYTSYNSIITLATLGLVLCCIGLVLFLLLSEILVIVRFYKHFFTDEGYLTFTLPVKKTTLLNSKTVMSLIFTFGSMLVFAFDVLLMLSVGIPEDLYRKELWADFFLVLKDIFTTLGGYSAAYIILGIAIFFTLLVAQMLFIFLCITLAASIASKHKVLAAIGIYYAATAAVSTAVQIMSIGGIYTVFEMIEKLENNQTFLSIAFVMFGLLGIVVSAAAIVYAIETYLLDKRLNLE